MNTTDTNTEKRRPFVEIEFPPHGASFNLNMKIDMEQIDHWTGLQKRAFFEEIAKVLAITAEAEQEHR